MKTLIAIPCMDMVHTEFFRSLMGSKMPPGEIAYSISASSLIYDARNKLTLEAIKSQCDRVMWLDSDMSFEPDIIQRLAARMDEGYDMVTGHYFSRRGDYGPIIYKDVGVREREDGKKEPYANAYTDYPRNQLFKIAGCGFGAVMCSINVLTQVLVKFGLPFSPILGFGEDISFCTKVNQLGIQIYCDSSIKVGHVGYKVITEEDHIKYMKTQKKSKH